MKRALVVFAIPLLVYYSDYFWLQHKMPAAARAFGTVQVEPYYAVRLKNGKTEFMFDTPRPQTCVNSLFPHLGYEPCWYLRRRTKKRIDI